MERNKNVVFQFYLPLKDRIKHGVVCDTDQLIKTYPIAASSKAMSHIVLRKWDQLKKKVTETPDIDVQSLIKLLLSWAEEIKQIKDIKIKKLYKEHLQYCEDINIEDVLYLDVNVWYSFEDLLNRQILSYTTESYSSPIVNVGNILEELLFFKSDIDCPCNHCGELRILTSKQTGELFFSCDTCTCLTDIDGNRVKVDERLYPASAETIKNLKIAPAKY